MKPIKQSKYNTHTLLGKLSKKISEYNCKHHMWVYCTDVLYGRKVKDCKGRYGEVHDIIQCEYCMKTEHHVNWEKTHNKQEEEKKFWENLKELQTQLKSKII